MRYLSPKKFFSSRTPTSLFSSLYRLRRYIGHDGGTEGTLDLSETRRAVPETRRALADPRKNDGDEKKFVGDETKFVEDERGCV